MYRPTAAGHGAREAPRTIVQDTIDERLVQFAKEWLDRGIHWYPFPPVLERDHTTKAVDVAALAINPLLAVHKHYGWLGTLISALWNYHCPEQIIIYPHNTPSIEHLGSYLLAKKTLIINGKTGCNTGYFAEGTIFVTADTGHSLGKGATGLIVTNEQTNTGSKGRCVPLTAKCQTFLDRLVDKATRDQKAAQRAFGDAKRIADTIHQLSRGGR